MAAYWSTWEGGRGRWSCAELDWLRCVRALCVHVFVSVCMRLVPQQPPSVCVSASAYPRLSPRFTKSLGSGKHQLNPWNSLSTCCIVSPVIQCFSKALSAHNPNCSGRIIVQIDQMRMSSLATQPHSGLQHFLWLLANVWFPSLPASLVFPDPVA